MVSIIDKKQISALLRRYDDASRDGDVERLQSCYSFRLRSEDSSSKLMLRGANGEWQAPDTSAIERNARRSFEEDFQRLEPAIRKRSRSRIVSITADQGAVNDSAQNLQVVQVERTVILGDGERATEIVRVGKRKHQGAIDAILSSLKGRKQAWYILSSEFTFDRVLSKRLGTWTFEYEVWSSIQNIACLANRQVELSAAGDLNGLSRQDHLAMRKIITKEEDFTQKLGIGLGSLLNETADKFMWFGDCQPPFGNLWKEMDGEISISLEHVEQPAKGLRFHLEATIFGDNRVNAMIENWEVISHIP